MRDRAVIHNDRGNNKGTLPLVEQMDLAIGEATTVMGAMMTELLRRSLRGGVMKIGEELDGFVADKVEATLTEKQPVIELMAAEAVVLDYLKAGNVTPKGFAAARIECKALIDALARRLKK